MNNKYEQLIEFIINDEKDKARELFHEVVVEKSREIYNELVAESEDESDGLMGELAPGDMEDEIASDEEGMDADDMDDMDDMDGEDDMDDMDGEDDMDDMDGEDDMEDRVVNLEDELDELKAEFERLLQDEEGEDEFGGEEEEADEGVMREYVEKVKMPSRSDTSDNSKSPVAKKNDMGGKAFPLGGGTDKNPDDKQYTMPKGGVKDMTGNIENRKNGNASKTFKPAQKPTKSEPAGVNKRPVID